MFEHNHVPELVQEILRGKALARIVESATVTDRSGSHVELKNLRRENARLKKLVANQALDIDMLKDVARGNW